MLTIANSIRITRGSNEKNPPVPSELIRFEIAHQNHIDVNPLDILFAQSLEHYVKVLIIANNKKIWATRRLLLHELIELLPPKTLFRLNKSCAVNPARLIRFEPETQILYFGDDYQVTVTHHINPFIKAQLSD